MTEQGGAGDPLATQVAVSLTPDTTTATEVSARRSAKPEGAGKVVWSTIRKRSLVTGAPVLFTNLRRIESVPKVELFAGSDVKSRMRLGGEEPPTVPSRRLVPKSELR